MIKPLLCRIEEIVVKGENADYQHFLLFPQCFQKLYQGCKKSGLCGKGLNMVQIWGLLELYGHKDILVNSSLKATKKNRLWSSQKFR